MTVYNEMREFILNIKRKVKEPYFLKDSKILFEENINGNILIMTIVTSKTDNVKFVIDCNKFTVSLHITFEDKELYRADNYINSVKNILRVIENKLCDLK